MPKAFTAREKELIRRRLVEAGYKRFSASGLSKTNVGELAEAARISKGAFYLFYESKEALFLDVAEMAENGFRQELLATINQAGATPRARLSAVFGKAFVLVRTVPVLRLFTSRDFDLLLRRVPAEKLQEHLASDKAFFEELIARCQDSGIPVRVPPEQIIRLLYPLVVAVLQEEDLPWSTYGGGVDLLLELIAAFCLGEVQLAGQGRLVLPKDDQGGRGA